MVSGRVIVFPTAAQATRMFAQYNGDLALNLKLATIVQLPAYGDQQSAFFQATPGMRGDIRVRTGAVVWRVEIKWVGTEKVTREQTLVDQYFSDAQSSGHDGASGMMLADSAPGDEIAAKWPPP